MTAPAASSVLAGGFGPAVPLAERRHDSVADDERRLEVPQLGVVGGSLREQLTKRPRIGHERVELGLEQHEDVPLVGQVAGLGVPAAELAKQHAAFVDDLDDRGLGALAVGHHVRRDQRPLDHVGELVIVGHLAHEPRP